MIERIFVEQGIKRMELEQYLKKELDKAGFTKAEVLKTPLVTRIVVNVTRPGLAIGKSGANIRTLTETLGKRFGIENPQLEIKEITQPALDAQAMADKIKSLIERGYSWRSVAYRTLRDIMEASAQGVEIIVSGKITGKGGRKKQQRIAEGYMKKVGDQVKLVDYAKAAAYPKVGAIGIKVRIVHPDTVFPDKVSISEILKKKAAGEAGKSEPAAPVAPVAVSPAAPAEAVAEVPKAEAKAEAKAGTVEGKKAAAEAKPVEPVSGEAKKEPKAVEAAAPTAATEGGETVAGQ
ncbi:MAG: 30S ribosomal protein S3 [Candidatus Diapherotrites archaeon]|uniref:Small ribosomal subunit protein uS3 n=2 Tax=Candidatus Iainarchaeum sp. TaxID=3101447 RepID=A0A8T4LB19_9ARCH|nr:30S ribosomal protein S3 [Candidatus Diapherotrites archaeon]